MCVLDKKCAGNNACFGGNVAVFYCKHSAPHIEHVCNMILIFFLGSTIVLTTGVLI